MSEKKDGSKNTSRGEGSTRILDEFSKLLTDAAGVAQGAKRDVESAFRSQAERMLDSLDVVQRDEFEVVKEMAARNRAEIDALKEQIAKLTKTGAGKAQAKTASAEKPATKKAPAKKSATGKPASKA